jgi:hypothetical protein
VGQVSTGQSSASALRRPAGCLTRESNQIAAFGLLEAVVADHDPGLLPRPKKTPNPSPDRSATAGAAASGDEPDNATRSGSGLGSEKPLRVGGCFEHGLSMQIESGIRPTVGPIEHCGILGE